MTIDIEALDRAATARWARDDRGPADYLGRPFPPEPPPSDYGRLSVRRRSDGVEIGRAAWLTGPHTRPDWVRCVAAGCGPGRAARRARAPAVGSGDRPLMLTRAIHGDCRRV